MPDTFTLEQIKAAFFKVEVDLWNPYLCSPQEQDESLAYHWDILIENLTGVYGDDAIPEAYTE